MLHCDSRTLATAAPGPATTQAAVGNEPLVGGAVRYAPPPAQGGWRLVSKSDDGLKAQYKIPDVAVLAITVTPEEAAMPAEQKEKMAIIIGKGIRESAKNDNRELLLPPRVEEDPRFYLKVHDRMRSERDRTADRLQIYRSLGLNFVHVAVTAFVDKPEEATPILRQAEELLASMRTTQGVKPTPFKRTGVRITPPVDWKQQKMDQPNGATATFSDATSALRQIMVRSKVLPKAARDDIGKRDAILQKMIDEERRLPPLGGKAAKSRSEQQESDPAFLRKLRSGVEREGKVLRVETRYLVVADVIVSVRSIAEEGDDEVGKLADALAAGIKAME